VSPLAAMNHPDPAAELAARRARARRSALLLGLVALAIYAGFIVSGGLGT